MTLRAVGKDAVNTGIVSAGAVGATVGGGCVGPESGVVGISQSQLEAKKPLLPNKSSKLPRMPGDGVETVMAVAGDEVMCPSLVGWVHKFAVTDNVPW